VRSGHASLESDRLDALALQRTKLAVQLRAKMRMAGSVMMQSSNFPMNRLNDRLT
jgi:hypothetical protein